MEAVSWLLKERGYLGKGSAMIDKETKSWNSQYPH